MSMRHFPELLLLLALGCSTTKTNVEQDFRRLAAQLGEEDLSLNSNLPPEPPKPMGSDLLQVAHVQAEQQKPAEGKTEPPKPLLRPRFPPDLPGADAPPIGELPKDPDQRQKRVRELFPPIEALPAEPPPALGPDHRPLCLADLEQLGKLHSPAVKSAVAAVEVARASAYQAGMYPNPSFGYEHDTVETGPAGYPGFWIDQVVKTGGKLTVQQAAATMDILTAKLAFRRTCSDLRYQIRGFYFAVLVARENLRASEALFQFVEEIYEMQVEQMGKGFGAVYEPMQLRPTVRAAKLAVIQARNQYHAAWRQLTATLGLPDMPPTQLLGQVDCATPLFEYADLVARLDKHTDVLTAHVAIMKAKYNLMFQKLIPLPDVDLRVLVQKDFTAPPNQIAHSFVMSMPMPLWDQNRGGIRAAQWQLAHAAVGPDNARNALIATLAEAYGRYLTARQTVEIVQEQLRDQVRAYRGLRQRYEAGPGVGPSFTDLFVAQQTLAGYVANYITALGQQWQAVVDVANLLQTEDLYSTGPQQPMPETPDMNHLQPPHAPVIDPPGPLAALLNLFTAPALKAPSEGDMRPEDGHALPPPPPGPAAPMNLPPPGPNLPPVETQTQGSPPGP